jgi:hypothetical protein
MANLEHSGQVFQSGEPRTVSYAFANPTTSGDANEIVAAQAAGCKIRVLAAFINGKSAGDTVIFKTATTAISTTFAVGAGVTVVLPYNPHGWFETAAAEALNVNLTTGNDIGVSVVWCITKAGL